MTRKQTGGNYPEGECSDGCCEMPIQCADKDKHGGCTPLCVGTGLVLLACYAIIGAWTFARTIAEYMK
jgi:hypothetical protein